MLWYSLPFQKIVRLNNDVSFSGRLAHFPLRPRPIYLATGAAAQRGPWPAYACGFEMAHNYIPQSVGLLWTSDQFVSEISTLQHKALTTDKYPCPLRGLNL